MKIKAGQFNFTFTHFLLLLAALGLSACTGMQTAQDYLLNDQEGLVFFTMTKSGQISSNFQLNFVNEASKKVITVSMSQGDKLDIGEQEPAKTQYRDYDRPLGKLVVLRLPAAVYHLDSWKSDKALLGKHSLPHITDKKFKVSANHALYLGNLHLLSDDKHASLFIRDNREHDQALFFERYPRVDKKRLLVVSKIFLDPAKNRERVFASYTGCVLKGYDLYSIKRLPATVAKFRTLQINSRERKISRIDGYRLRLRKNDGAGSASMKVELSDVSRYVADKSVIEDWIENIKSTVKTFEVEKYKTDYFTEYQLVTNVLEEKRMVYMSVLLDDLSQIITSVSFINPPEFLRTYKTSEEFIPRAKSIVTDYRQCVIKNLNEKL